MPWGRVDDRLAMSVKIRGLVEPGAVGAKAKRQRAEAIGVWVQLLSWVSGERSDGFVTADILDLFGWPAATERLLRARFGMASLLHTREDGEPCSCMAGRTWRDDFEYLMHDYLDRNPSKSENEVHRAKARELKDPALKAKVRDRDRDICRYCARQCKHSDRTSDAGVTFDHVDPEIADGMSNLVVACRGCNNRKRRRTPEAAGLVLLLEPGPTPGPTPDLSPGTGLDSGPDSGPTTGPGPDPPPGPRSPSPEVCAQTSVDTTAAPVVDGSPGRGRAGPGSAPGPGPPRPGGPTAHRVGPPTTPRGPLHGSPYQRNTRPLPEHHAGTPPDQPSEGQP